MLAADSSKNIVDAVKVIYASHLYERLELERTKQWHLGPVALYQEMCDM